jgi:hypothetical protein
LHHSNLETALVHPLLQCRKTRVLVQATHYHLFIENVRRAKLRVQIASSEHFAEMGEPFEVLVFDLQWTRFERLFW